MIKYIWSVNFEGFSWWSVVIHSKYKCNVAVEKLSSPLRFLGKIWLPWWKSSIEHLQIIHIFEYEPLTFIVGIINMELAFNFYSTLQPQAVSWLLSPDYTERYNAVMWKLQGAIAPYWEKPGALLSSGLLQFFLLSDWLSIDSAILSNVWIITIAAFIWNMVRIKVILNWMPQKFEDL